MKPALVFLSCATGFFSSPTAHASERLFAIPQNGKWGFIERYGQIVLPPKFDEIGTRSEGMWPVRVGKKWGFVREERGYSQIAPRFDEVSAFREGLCFARSGAKWGAIGKNGLWQIPPRFTLQKTLFAAPVFSENLAAVSVSDAEVEREKLSGRWGFINRRGEWVLRPQFLSAAPFSQGMAEVSRTRGSNVQDGWMRRENAVRENAVRENAVRENAARFTFVSSPVQGGIQFYEPFMESLAAVETTVAGKRKVGFVNREGKWAIPPRFDAILGYNLGELHLGFRNGLAQVVVGGQSRETLGIGWIDSSGNWRIPPKFQGGGADFSQGLAPVAILSGGTQIGGFINREGAWKIEPQFQKMGVFSEGLAPVQRPGKPWEFIDQSGKTVIAARFDYVRLGETHAPPDFFALQFQDGLAWVREASTGESSGRKGAISGYIDKKGNWVWSAASAEAKRA